ncbi:hypothetical protein DUI87_00924 [Hirundo rustica rustica]|uniref:Reverse transcriptase domain-containing protein n=1 Tax=Hirundo rustica rustica TaxID=333673 RepID=A0A3M0L3Z4_HIRRU|nr:hypothetical protein DUI87_00924 [Hirundo rustica rustica]
MDNRIYWTVWIRWPGTSDPQKYMASVNTGAQYTLMPSRYVGTESISISGVTGGSQQLIVLEAKVSLTGNGCQKHPIVTGPEAPCILGIDYLRNGYFKDPKGYRWAFGIAAVETEDIRQLNTLPGLSVDSSVVGLLRVEEQWVPITTATVHHRQYRTDRDSVIPIHEMIRKTGEPRGGQQGSFTFQQPYMASAPTICHGLIQTALEKGEAPEHLQYIDDIIVWGNTAGEVFEKGEKIIQILLKTGFAIKKSEVRLRDQLKKSSFWESSGKMDVARSPQK